MQEIDIDQYYNAVEPHIAPFSSIFSMVFKKQAKDLGIGDQAKPEDVDALVDRVSSAMEFFVGANMKSTIRTIMRKELRRLAPEYFMKKYGI